MPDDPKSDNPAPEENADTGEPRGFLVPVAVILIGILIVLVIFMNFTGQGTTAATAITENTWALRSFQNPDGTAKPVLNGTTITATFSSDGKLTGSGGCNQYSARYMVRSTLMVVSRVTSIATACQDKNAILQEEQFSASIENAAALRVHDHVLTLYDTEGRPLLVFIPHHAGT